MERKDFIKEAGLAQDKDELLALLLEEEGIDLAPDEAAIAPRKTAENPPLSYTQQAQWFLHQLDPNNPFYNICATVQFDGSLDVAALEQSLNEIIRRHEVLRTTFKTVEGQPVQAIHPHSTLPLPIIDLQEFSTSEQTAEIQRLATEAAQQPFDLTCDRLLRTTLLQLGKSSYVLVLVIHHIVSDGFTLGVLMRELGLFYDALVSSEPSPLPALPIQYADYAVWQREWLQGERRETLLSYWKQQLAGIPPLLELPRDRPRPPVQTFRGDTVSFHIDPTLTQQLRSLSQASGTTLFMTLLAGFNLLLHRYSGQSDIVVGSLIANRDRPELEGLMGFFANFLALRTQFSEGLSFRDLLAQVQAMTLEAYAHQALPFEILVEALQPERALHSNPLFQVVFELQNAPLPSTELPNLAISPTANLDTGTVRSDLEVHLWEDIDGVKGGWVYSADLFDRSTIERMARHFQTLLEGIVANPDQLLSDLSLLTSAEQAQWLGEWSHIQPDNPIAQRLQQLFEAQAPNLQFYLLDQYLNPVPIGVPGEVYIGGIDLDQADLNQSKLTADAFIPNPFLEGERGKEKGERGKEKVGNPKSKIQNPKSNRLYKTGDLARYLPNGQIEWRGRLEHQETIRGFRVNLDELERLLNRQEQVQQCTVIAREDRVNGPRLEKTNQPESETKLKIAISATFTAEPVANTLQFWEQEFDSAWAVEFAPYNQVFQQLLDPQSLLGQNQTGVNIVLVRLEDWIRHAPASDGADLELTLTQTTAELIQTLKQSCQSTIPHILGICPSANPQYTPLIQRLEAQIQTELDAVNTVHVLPASEVMTAYPVDHIHDAFADEQGHIPYTAEFFTALGSSLARKLHALHRPPFKVIVLDCDNTLWKGVCGEVGPTGVELTPAHQQLQAFMAAQAEHGMLLCLCSKNVEADVLAVFEQRPDMPLTLDHIVAHQINWRPKSENITALAQQLNLGLDSFIFLDDNPVECAEVKTHCPQVLTLQLPSQLDHFPHFLSHVWAFDQLKATEADRRRTELYQQNIQRQQLQQSLTFTEFLESLALQISIAPMQPQQLGRVAQLTQRTNQFNATTIRRSEGEIQALCQNESYTCLTVEVKDRFGDYGLVGVVLFKATLDALEVDTFLLSCRVLGRGVEHQMLARLGAIAREQNIDQVVVPYRPTAKNLPIGALLNQVGRDFKHSTAEGEQFVFPAVACESIRYQPESSVTSPESTSDPAPPAHTQNGAVAIAHIVDQLSTVEQIQQALEQQQVAWAGQKRSENRGKYLAAYVVGDDDLDLDGLKASLKQQLPDYMLPRVVASLETLPLTPDGEVDRQALRACSEDLNDVTDFVAPRTQRQTLIATLFAKALSLPVGQIGLHDGFFELGGHSLLAMQLVARLREAFDVEVPLSVLFESSTVEGIEQILTNDLTPGLVIPAIVLAKRDGSPIPLSYAQERLWFLAQLEGRSATYNVPASLQIDGVLDIDALQQAIDELASRHESLRTTFPMVNGVAVQQIAPDLHIPLRVIAVSDLDMPLSSWLAQAAQQPFDLEVGPLLRATLVHMNDETSVLALTIHHIISDGWSMGVFVRELTSLYDAYRQGQSSPLPPLPLQYADYTLWQRQWLQGETLESQLSYWRRQLAGAPALLDLPTDHPRPAAQTFRGRTYTLNLPLDLSQRVNALAQQHGVTLFMILLTAFQSLLYRYSGQPDIVVGTPIANRQRGELEALIGFFTNTLALRVQIGDSDSVKDLLHNVRRVALEAYAHQDTPFEQVVEALQPERSLAHSPLVQVMFVLQNATVTSLQLAEATLTSLAAEMVTAKFDLTLWMEETAQGLVASWEYNSDLFEADTITRMASHFETLLRGMVEDSSQPVAMLPMLSEAERRQLLVEWNDTATDYPSQQCIHQLFEAQVERTPDAIAVIFDETRLSYRELNDRANQLAHYLQTLGVGSETLMGLCVERSVEMVVGLLGILKAGGAYAPLDPSYPPQRLQFMLTDTQTPVLLTQERLLANLPEHEAQVICLDRDWVAIAQSSPENLDSDVLPDNLAYVNYTSGSTGTPKGVCVTQRGVVRLVVNAKYVSIRDRDIFLQLAPISFDAATFEIWGALLNGAQLVLYPEPLPTLDTLASILQQEAVSILWLTAGLFHLVVEQQVEALSSVKQLLAGGDVLSPKHIQKALSALPDCTLINGYGPTENTTFTCCHTISPAIAANRSIPIGRPINNTQVYVLDSRLQPVPIGVPGELYIGGDGLARGYLNRPDLTEQSWGSNPFNSKERLYRTGDIVRCLPDGNIEFLSRRDFQVKIRGFRIELSEIESVLSSHAQVQQCVVVVKEDAPGAKRLEAYVVGDDDLDIPALKAHLKQQLPDYMTPSVVTPLAALPLTPNGKVDRRALPEPAPLQMGLGENFVPPQTPSEQILANIWEEVLRIEQVGIHDNFFELGGDSILSIQIVAQAQQSGLKLTTKQLFQHQTIAELATAAIPIAASVPDQGLVEGTAPLTPIQHWFFEQTLAESHHWNMVLLLEVVPHLKPDLLEQAVGQLLLHHDALRLRFTSSPSGWRQGYAEPDQSISFSSIDLSHLEADQQQAQLESTAAELQSSLNLSSGPLVRVVWFKLGGDRPDRLLLIAHHLVMDGVSWRILLEDLTTVYQQLERGESIQLPAKTTSFQDWGNRLLDYVGSNALAKELDYWLAEPCSEEMALPVDYPSGRTANTVGSTAHVVVSLSEEQTRTLLKEVPKVYNTQINDVLLTALVQSFAQWTGKQALRLNLEGHGREDLFEGVDLSRTVGWFTSIFPVSLALDSGDELGDALKSIKEQLRQVPSRGIGYGVLRYLSLDEESRSKLQALPAAEVSFNYLGQLDGLFANSLISTLASESTGLTRSPLGQRRHLLEVDGVVVSGKLRLDWTYSEAVHNRSTIEHLAENFIEALQRLIEHCQSPEAGGYTPSDFPAAKLSQSQLDELMSQLTIPIDNILELSPDQERMWFFTQAEPDSPALNMPLAFRLQGSLKVSSLERSLREIVHRHASLRTRFPAIEGRPKQVIVKSNAHDVILPLVDLQYLSPGPQQQQGIQDHVIEEAERLFDLTQDAPFRAKLLRLAAEEHILLITVNQIIVDGWSLDVLFQELSSLYQAFSKGQASPLPNLTMQYGDFIVWQRQRSQDQALTSQLAYWRQQLGGRLPVLDLPTDRPHPPKQTLNGAFYTSVLPPTLADALKALSRQEKMTLYMTLLAAYKTLLHIYSGQDDIIIGSPISGRDQPETEGVIGLAAKALVCRTSLAGDPSFRNLLTRVRDVVLAAYQHQDVPFHKLIEVLKPVRDPSRSPVYQASFALQNFSLYHLNLPGLRVHELNLYPLRRAAKFDITLFVRETSDGLKAWWEYNTDLFDADTIVQMSQYFQTLLEGIVANPDQSLSALAQLIGPIRSKQIAPPADGSTPIPVSEATTLIAIEQFLSDLHALGVKLWLKDDKLRYKAPKDSLTPTLLAQLRERKPEILEFLRQADRILNH